jgi:hypothetical protein
LALTNLEIYISSLKKENSGILDAGREKIRDYELLILETRRHSNEEFAKLKEVIRRRDFEIEELRVNSYRKSLLKKYLMETDSDVRFLGFFF